MFYIALHKGLFLWGYNVHSTATTTISGSIGTLVLRTVVLGGWLVDMVDPVTALHNQSLASMSQGLGVKLASSGEGRELNNILTAGYWKSLIQGILWLSFKDNPSENIDKLGTFLALLLSHSISPAQEM